MVLVEVAREDGLVAVLDVHADEPAGRDEIMRPAHAAVGAGELLHHGPAAAQIERGAAGRDLLEALMLGVVAEQQRVCAARDGGGLAERRIGDRQPVARRHVALGVVGEGGIVSADPLAEDGRDGMRLGTPGVGIDVDTDVGLGEEVADRVIAEGLGERRRAQRDGGGGQPVQAVVAEAFGEARVGIAAREQLAQRVVAVAEARHRAGRSRRNAGEQSRVGIEGLAGDDAVAGRLLRQVQLRVARATSRDRICARFSRSQSFGKSILLVHGQL